MSRFAGLFGKLKAPFAEHQLRNRLNGGRYVDPFAIIERLDDVFGPENWWEDYEVIDDLLLCDISIRLSDGVIVNRIASATVCGNKQIHVTDAFIEAASRFGIGRYLVADATEAERLPKGNDGNERADTGPREDVKDYARVDPNKRPDVRERSATGKFDQRDPTTGRSLFVWIKHHEEQNQAQGLLAHINRWGKSKKWPLRMVDWEREDVKQAVAECKRFMNDPQGASESLPAPKPSAKKSKSPQAVEAIKDCERVDGLTADESVSPQEIEEIKSILKKEFGDFWDDVAFEIAAAARNQGLAPFLGYMMDPSDVYKVVYLCRVYYQPWIKRTLRPLREHAKNNTLASFFNSIKAMSQE